MNTSREIRMTERTIEVEYLTRVEGEGAMYVKLEEDRVVDLHFKIFEPPRFFEAFLRGRSFADAPDLTSRICGICPVAYQTSAVNAIEDAFGMTVPDEIRDLRKLIYCGEWIESHALHVYMLHAPDFMGYASAIHMAQDLPALVERGLRLKKVGNDLMAAIGGREIHPINARAGGFFKAPAPAVLEALVDDLQWARDASLETTKWVAAFPFVDFEQDYEFVALSRPDEYAVVDGRIVSNRGLDLAVQEWGDHFEERHVEWSNALYAVTKARGSFMTGPCARYSLGFDKLHPVAQRAAREAGLGPVCTNPFKSIIVRSVELVQACEEALRIIDRYEPPVPPAVETTPRAGVGHGASEAPRGICYHRYGFDDQGKILDCRIVSPTSQNQLRIEEDLWSYVPAHAHLPDDELQWQLEQAIRNYDPCISCATHFLDLTIERA